MPAQYIRFSAKYLDGVWRKQYISLDTENENRKYAEELVEMFRYFTKKGHFLAFTVELVTRTTNGESTEVIGTEI